MKKNNLNLKIALNICNGTSKSGYRKFKSGDFTFDEISLDGVMDICWSTIDYIKKMNGYSKYTDSSRFWGALLRLTRHHDFKADKWRQNLEKLIDQCTPRAKGADYVTMLQNIYNWRNTTKIELSKEFEE